MNLLFPVLLVFAVALFILKNQQQKQRIAILGKYLSRFDIETLMSGLISGYMRALGEDRPERQAQVWAHLNAQEDKLNLQFTQFAKDFGEVWADDALISTLPLAFPWSHKLFPAATFDARQALQIHAQGIAHVVASQQDAKDRAFTLTAELMLMQHTCHWYCRSFAVANARVLAQHKTQYAQVLAAVSPETRAAYRKLTVH